MSMFNKQQIKEFLVSVGYKQSQVDKMSNSELENLEKEVISYLEKTGNKDNINMALNMDNTKVYGGITKELVRKTLTSCKAEGKEPFFMFQIDRENVENMDFKSLDKTVKVLTSFGKELYQTVTFSISGYDDDTRELFQISECVKFAQKMIKKHPQLIYFFNVEWTPHIYALISENAYAESDKFSGMTTKEIYKDLDLKEHKAEDFGMNVKLVFDNEKMNKLKLDIIKFGMSIGDLEGAKKVVSYINSLEVKKGGVL